MKVKESTRPLFRTAIVLFIFAVAFACAKILPAAKDNFKEAKELLKLGKKIEAIEKATLAVVLQPDYEKAQKFIYDNWDVCIPSAVSEAKRLEKTTKIEEAEKVVYINQMLISIYNNLGKLKLPFTHPKGKWTWETKIVDYAPNYEKSLDYAFNLFFKTASAKVDASELKDSYDLFHRMHTKYTRPTQKDSVAVSVALVYNKYGAKYENSTNVDEVINAHTAYKYSLKFVKGDQKIVDLQEKAALRISDLFVIKAKELHKSNDIDTQKEALAICNKALKWNRGNEDAKALDGSIRNKIYTLYFAKGQTEENKNTIASLEEAIKFYELALKWKKNDEAALNKISSIKEKIAEKYYQQGVKLEKSGATKDEILKNYKLAQKWVPQYKDTQKRIHTVTIIDEIIKLEKNIAFTKKENERTRSNVSSTAQMLGKANDGLNKVTYVSTKFKDLHGSMKTIITTCSALTGIPVVGTVASGAKTTVSVAKQPIDKVVLTFTNIEKPVITPSKKVVSKSKNLVDSVNVKMNTVSSSLATAKTSAQVLRECIQNMDKVDELKAIENEIILVNKNLVKINNEFKNVNNSVEGIKGVATTFYGYVSPINEVEKGIRSMSGAISTIKSATDGINKVLKQKIPVPFVDDPSIKDVLGATTGALAALMDQAMKPLKPYLNKLANQIPPIPGIDAFTANIEKLKAEYQKIEKEYNKAKASYDKLTDYEKQLKTGFNKIIDKAGCGTKI